MSHLIYRNGKATEIELASKEMNSGGQGRIYRIKSPYYLQDYCAKIYKDLYHATSNQKKIEYMVMNKPTNSNMSNIRMCWPEYIIYDNKGVFVGILCL